APLARESATTPIAVVQLVATRRADHHKLVVHALHAVGLFRQLRGMLRHLGRRHIALQSDDAGYGVDMYSGGPDIPVARQLALDVGGDGGVFNRALGSAIR